MAFMQIPKPALAVAMSALLSSSALCQTASPFTLQDLGHGAWAAIDNPAAKADQSGSNAGFVIGPESVLVVDTFENPAAAKKMLEVIHEKTSLPVRYVVNTHYHLDHVAGNAIFAEAGATVMAQENVRVWERTENLKFFGEKITPDQRGFVEKFQLPDVTYAQGATAYIGNKRGVVLRVMPGHTGGDTVVYDAGTNVVFCGDLFWNHTLPNLIDASTREWIETLDTLVRDYPAAKFVPGHGDKAGDAADVRAFRDYLIFLREAIARAQTGGASSDAVLKAVLPQVTAKYSGWAYFDFAEPDIQRTDEELRGIKRLPPQPVR
jgi:glyoxylase-like metal-dependent hydrolase (beta-lactamase superfamily II)